MQRLRWHDAREGRLDARITPAAPAYERGARAVLAKKANAHVFVVLVAIINDLMTQYWPMPARKRASRTRPMLTEAGHDVRADANIHPATL